MISLVNPQLPGGSFAWPGHGSHAATGILLIHGFSATTAEVRPLARRLADAGFSVVGPLLPGHGSTPQELNGVRWQDWASAVEQAYNQLGQSCGRLILGGESMGGLLALDLAARHPEAAAILTYAPALRLARLTGIAARLLAPFVSHLTPKTSPRTVVDDLWQGYPVRPLRAVIQLDELRRFVAAEIPCIRQPLLVVQGRLDTTIDPRGAESLYTQAASPVKEFHWMEQSSHCVILDQQLPAVVELTLNFITNLDRAEMA